MRGIEENIKKEKIISFIRAIFLLTSLILIKLDFIPTFNPNLFDILLIVYSIYILFTTFFPIYSYGFVYRHQIFSAIDTLLIASLVYLTGGVLSSLYLFLLFPIISASLRYDFKTSITSAILVTLIFLYFGIIQEEETILSSVLSRVAELGGLSIILAIFLNYVAKETLKLQLKMKESETFHKITQIINSSLDFDEILFSILDSAIKLLDADGGTIFIKDKETGELIFEKVVGEKAKNLMGKRIKKGEGIVGWVIEKGEGIVIENASHDKRFSPYFDEITGFRTGSIICTPLRIDNEIIGALEIVNNIKKKPFTKYELELAMNFANEASIALNKAILYNAVNTEKERMQKILENIADGLIILDNRKNLKMINPIAQNIFSITSQDLGKNCKETLKCKDLKGNILCVDCPLDKLYSQQIPYLQYEMKIYSQNLKEIILGCNLSAVWDNSKLLDYILAVRDISLSKEIDRLKSEFVANVSHELKTPLTAIKGYSELLLTQKPEEEKFKNYLKIINQEAERLTKLINDLLDLSKLEEGRMEIKREIVDIKNIIKERALFFQSQTTKHSFIFSFPAYPILISGDQDRLTQVFHNLIDNAVKYSPKGGNITLSIQDNIKSVIIEVSDQGEGIAPEHLPYIFDRFYRADSSLIKRKSGTGLGLSIVKSIVEAHKGKISVNSKVGEGTTFILEFPRDFPLTDPITKTIFLPYFFPLVWQSINNAGEKEIPFVLGYIEYEFSDNSLSLREKDIVRQKLAQLLKRFIRPTTDILAHGLGHFYLFVLDFDPLKLQIFIQRLSQALSAFSKIESSIRLKNRLLQFPSIPLPEIKAFLSQSFYGLPQEEIL
ncbi:MAG: ATP-binding protein [Dictyoglomus sp.]|nr:ATP-binding protein [Dictyoglomus sp.]MCX7845685.1 ATP-binding protein [Dictyoglomaceae bacterium]MDW8188479.1 ATP-binding protein [Dictyoglomus sp.]